MSKGAVVTIGFLLLIGFISFTTIWKGSKYECEVCINYKDREVCQKVEGMEKQDTIMSGITTACGGAANGMTENIECQAIPATKIVCKEL